MSGQVFWGMAPVAGRGRATRVWISFLPCISPWAVTVISNWQVLFRDYSLRRVARVRRKVVVCMGMDSRMIVCHSLSTYT